MADHMACKAYNIYMPLYRKSFPMLGPCDQRPLELLLHSPRGVRGIDDPL